MKTRAEEVLNRLFELSGVLVLSGFAAVLFAVAYHIATSGW